uniref:von Willebrand factor A domain containing 5B1 n=1 Tax=Zonotrichia albicollis TaxID=44394 RepID=A0A8D2MBB2_ZONAL
MEIRGPCLLAGVESPTHEIRADADPSARSAKSIVITLANKHTFDRPVEILIHPSEPHMPHVLMEEGDMTPAEYERHLKGKNDFIKGTKKDPSAKKKVRNTSCRKRLNKDIPHHPVIMLNFCPDLRTVQPGLRTAQGEFIFLVERSRSMSADALLVILKSLMPACLFNIIGFGSTFKTLFPVSQAYCESLLIACQSIRRIRADMGSTNLLSPLKWLLRQPLHRGHPRLLFVLTAGAISSTGKVLELLRDHSCSTRCYSFGLGPNACRRLVRGLAAVSRGVSEFLEEGERLQPKVQSLKKAMAPVLSDVSVEWVFPESTEVLVSPVSSSCLFPGDRLVSYSVVCDTSLYLSNPRAVSLSQERGCWGVHSTLGSVHGQGDLDMGAACGSPRSPRALCRALVKGLRNNEPVQWEVTFDIHPLFRERESHEDADTDLWSETFHHLAAKALIQDLEQLAERECEIEHGNAQLAAGRPCPASGGLSSSFSSLWSENKTVSPIHAFFLSYPQVFGARASLCAHHPLQVSLQLACGAFLLNSAFCDAVNIPMEKLKWTSPFTCHRLSLSPSAEQDRAWDAEGGPELQGMLWATAVALAWLEHSSASYFIEWELVAAKASLWLSEQDFPQGSSLATVKAAAQQLFVLLRHWDENLEFNLLCYNPGSV